MNYLITESISTSHVKRQFWTIWKIIGTETRANSEILFSLDVISLFTNIPFDLAYQSLMNRWNFIELNTSIPLDDFLQAIKFVLSSTFFTFNIKIYKQTFGVPMGFLWSPTIVDLVMRDLEDCVLSSVKNQPTFYYWYDYYILRWRLLHMW